MPQDGIPFLKALVTRITDGSMSLADFEAGIQPDSISKWYWSTKLQLERCRNSSVILLLKFRPQYAIGLDEDLKEVSTVVTSQKIRADS